MASNSQHSEPSTSPDILSAANDDVFRALADTAPVLIWISGTDKGCFFFNKGWLEFTGRTLEQEQGEGWVEGVHPDDLERCIETYSTSFDARQPFRMEYRLRRADGAYRWLLDHGTPRFNPDGTFAGFIGSCIDISDIKDAEAERAALLARAEAARAEAEASERRTAFLAEASETLGSALDFEQTLQTVAQLMVPRLADWCVVDMPCPDGRIEMVAVAHPDPAHVRWARTLRQRFPPRMDAPQGVGRVLRTGEPAFYPEVPMDQLAASADSPEHREVLLRIGFRSVIIVPLIARGQTLGALTLIWSDSDRRYTPADLRFAEELASRAAVAVDNARLLRRARESEERYRLLARATNDVIWDWNLGRDEILWNESIQTVFGHTKVRTTDGNWWKERIHPDDRPRVVSGIERVLAGGSDSWSDEYRFCRADGTYAAVLDRGYVLRSGEGAALRAIGSMLDQTERRRAADEREALLRTLGVERVRLAMLNESLEARVSERTQELEQAVRSLREEAAERERAQQALAHANAALQQRNQELQDFAYTASHDLQEPLRKIRTFVNLLRVEHEAALPEEGQMFMERIDAAAARMSQFITDLLRFSRVTTRSRVLPDVDLDAILQDVMSDLEVSLTQTNGRVEAQPLGRVDADPLQMRQVLLNLIGNALKFHRPEAPPVICVRAEQAVLPISPGSPPVEAVRLTVEDNGIGFDEKYLDRIFAPFQRLHERGRYEGTGMGLAICRKIAERHGGAITAHSTPGQGSAFVVVLPRHQPRDEEAAVR